MLDSYADIASDPWFAQLALQEHSAPSSGVVPVRCGGDKSPLFLVHDITGTGRYFSAFTDGIDRSIPVYGLLAVPMYRTQSKTLEGMATRLVAAIRSVQPFGPYHLAGFSFGGVLAYEVAIQLLGQDETLAFLGLIATPEPSRWYRSYSEALGLERAVLSESMQGLEDRVVDDLLRKCGDLDSLTADPEDHPPHLQYCRRVLKQCAALRSYASHPISVPMHLFVSHDCVASAGTALLGWESVLSPNRVLLTDVSGDAGALLPARDIGEAVSRILRASCAQPDARRNPNEACLMLQTGQQDQAPLFCIPGAGDNVVNFLAFGGALSPARPVYGLQPRGMDYTDEPHATVEAVANAWLPVIGEVQPRGPVHLLGHSFGGWVALEIAHRLIINGRDVASLTLVDTEVPGRQREFTAKEALTEWIRAMELSTEQSLEIDPEELASLSVTAQAQRLHERLVRLGIMSKRSAPFSLQGPIRTFCTALRTGYEPRQVYPNELHLVLVSDSQLDEEANYTQRESIAAGWRQWVPRLNLLKGPGNHFSVLKPPQALQLAHMWSSLARR